MKRFLDIIIATIALVILLPLIILIVIILLTYRGNPMFFQTRVGRNGNQFTLFKFRSMSKSIGNSSWDFDLGDRSRVTRFGRMLRHTKLDEIPQLVNVIRGDMSLVGPRPEVPRWTSVYPERWIILLSVRPGINDPASIAFRNEESILAASDDPNRQHLEQILPRKLNLSEEYVRNCSLSVDFTLIVQTILVVLGIKTGSSDRNKGQ